MPPDPPTLFTLTHTQCPYQSEIVCAGPASHETVQDTGTLCAARLICNLCVCTLATWRGVAFT